MGKETVVYTHNRISFNHKKERSYANEPRQHMLSERGKIQKTTYCAILFIRNVQNRQITHRNRKSGGGYQEGQWRNNCVMSTTGIPFGVTKMLWN